MSANDAVDGSTAGIAMCHGGYLNRQKGEPPKMDVSTIGLDIGREGERSLTAWLRDVLQRFGGVLVFAIGLYLGVCLWGFDANDPSFNRAVATTAIANPGGRFGAIFADLGMQLFGRASWVLVAVCLALGARMTLARPLRWPWLPLVTLPLALLAVSAWLAPGAVPADGSWPFRTGVGGLVGDLLFHNLQSHMSLSLYGWISAVLALVLVVLSLGLRWGESLDTARELGGHAGRVGRRVGFMAATASDISGRWVGERMEQRRINAADRARKLDCGEDDRGWSLLAALKSLFRRQPAEADYVDVEDFDLGIEPDAPKRKPNRRAAASVTRKPVAKSDASPAEPPAMVQQDLPFRHYELPDLDFLTPVRHATGSQISKAMLAEMSGRLESVLDDFGVRGEIIDAKPGPVITLYELEPAPGTRAQRVISLADDIARSLCAMSVRVATVPGRNVIGIELPNDKRKIVFLKEILQHDAFAASEARLALALGNDISGHPIIVDLARMPHLLIAGTTGSGKSVAINAMILSLLYRLTPEHVPDHHDRSRR